MFKIYDGRSHFYQWDIDRKLIVEDASISEVHFCNQTDNYSLVCKTYIEDGLNLVNVPNILLQNDWRINVYAYDSNYTKFSEQFDVIRRCKPEDYVYTETEVLNYNTLSDRITKIEEGGTGLEPLVGTNKTLTPWQIREAFLQGQPIVFSFIDALGEVAAIFQSFELYDDIIVASTILPPLTGSQDMGVVLVTGYLSSNVWDLSETLITNPDDIQTAINTALEQAKESGEFDGKSAYSYAVDGGYTGTEAEFAAKLAAEKLPNPYPLTFTGAVNETYDGSSAKTIEIPSGGGGGLGDFELIGTVDFSQEGMAAASAGVDFEVSDVSEIVLVYNDLVNSTSSNSSVWVFLNKSSGQIESKLSPESGKSGTPFNGWVFIKPLPGVGLTGIQSSSAVSATNYTLGNAKTPYNIIPLASDFRITKISIQNPPTQYYAVGGTVKLYVR